MSDSPTPGDAEQKPNQQADPAADSTLAKKYGGDWKKADAGYFELVNHSKKQQQQIDQLAAAVKQMADQNKPAAPDKWAKLSDEYGLPASELRALINEEAAQIARTVVAEQFAPIAGAVTARQVVASKFKDFATIEPQVMEFVHSDPDRAAKFNELSRSHPDTALELAVFEFKAQQPLTQRQTDSPSGAAARAAAGSPTGGVGSGGRTPQLEEGPTEDELKAAREHAAQTRDLTGYLNVKFKGQPLTWTEQMLAAQNRRE